LPIFGVRGANTGFQDAQSLGWQLAHVVKGLASKRQLDNYSAERVGAAREIIEESGKSTPFHDASERWLSSAAQCGPVLVAQSALCSAAVPLAGPRAPTSTRVRR
jgi:2-polyprenyl-6-methoxyphenol hydroxylase-like FAD-dependent oxidoreductase